MCVLNSELCWKCPVMVCDPLRIWLSVPQEIEKHPIFHTEGHSEHKWWHPHTHKGNQTTLWAQQRAGRVLILLLYTQVGQFQTIQFLKWQLSMVGEILYPDISEQFLFVRLDNCCEWCALFMCTCVCNIYHPFTLCTVRYLRGEPRTDSQIN